MCFFGGNQQHLIEWAHYNWAYVVHTIAYLLWNRNHGENFLGRNMIGTMKKRFFRGVYRKLIDA